jgi:hypothetical protein
MGEWQDNQEPIVTETPTRVKWFIMLAEALEGIESAYIMGNIDRSEYESQLQELDGKLGIIGLALATKPWVKQTPNRL